MRSLFLDFETFWSDDYTLKKVTPVEYIMDPRFEALGCAFVDGNSGAAEWVDGPDLPRKFQTIDWSQIYAISHNALFDMLILSLRYDVYPKMYGDTLGMARNWLAHMLKSLSLDSVSSYFGLPPKWQTVNKTKGVNFVELTRRPELHKEVGEYAIDDAQKCRTIFTNILAEGFPPKQLRIIDLVVRMAAQPIFVLNQTILAEHLAQVKRDKQELLEKAGLIDVPAGGLDEQIVNAKINLLSDERFAALLLMHDCMPPMKRSKTTGKMTYAFAKTDMAFTMLLEHGKPAVQTLVAARLGHKSTLEESRTERMLAVARCAPAFPIALKYSGAHTHRFSGDWKLNSQNLTRGSKMRYAIEAPKGKKVIAVDARQIEARFNATLSGQWDLVEQFRRDEDVYALFAQEIYQHPVNKNDHPQQRFVGKTGVLSLGYGASPPVFQNMCRVEGGVYLTDSEATSIVFVYRQKYKQIVQNWEYADKVVIPMLAHGELPFVSMVVGPTHEPHDWRAWGPLGIERYALQLPSGNRLRYRDLHQEVMPNGRQQWTYMRGALNYHLYGAKTVENAIQALAFEHIMEVALRVYDLSNGLLWPRHQVHDELIYVEDDRHAEGVAWLVGREMAKSPEWMPMAPLAAEAHIGQSYGHCK